MTLHPLVLVSGKTLLKGVAYGPLFFYEGEPWIFQGDKELKNDSEPEVEKYSRAISITKKELYILLKRFEEFQDGEAAEIFRAHLAILEDPLFTQKIEEEIRSNCTSSVLALEKVLGGVIAVLEASKNAFFAERVTDIKDLAQRIRLHLHGIQPKLPNEFQGAIVCVNEVTPSMAAEGALKGVKGFISIKGSAASHTSVVLKSRSIPHLILEEIAHLQIFQGQATLLDGYAAEILFNPNLVTLTECFKKQARSLAVSDAKNSIFTADGVEIRIYSTFDGVEYSPELKNGISLYRTEFILLHDREVAFCQERQVLLYQSIIEEVFPHKVVFRLFDLGGDKNFLHDTDEKAKHLRSIQYLLYRTEILDLQIRSLIQASIDRPLYILIPFVTSDSEVRILREKIQTNLDFLQIDIPIHLGAMIEAPLSEESLENILSIVDFIAIGTNDLTQGLISIHRDSPDFCLFQPDLFRTIKQVIDGAKRFGISVSVCGEIVSNPIFTEALLGLGATELSCSFHEIPDIKAKIASVNLQESIAFAERVCSISTPVEIKELFLERISK
ncbi:MAG: putative PEP-binding protein [Chlamydiia bacterium]